MKVLLFGASGLLGTELMKLNPQMICPSHEDCDITNEEQVRMFIFSHKPDIIINAVAIIDNRSIERNSSKAVKTNIVGSAFIALYAELNQARYIYISTDYVYKGDHGNYKESDEILPFNLYSWLKLGGECSARSVKNHLIIRTSFGDSRFAYGEAFTDKYSSKDYVDVIAPIIYEAALSPLTGVLNVGTERKSLFSYATKRDNPVMPVKIGDTSHHTPCDTSLNLQKWIDYKNNKPIAKPHDSCRVCGGKNLSKYLDLNLMPLANNLEFTSIRAKEKECFPLQVMFCNDCFLSQLSVVIDPEKMFSYYTYRSSVNGGYVKHCLEMAIDLREKFNLTKDSFHIDIAGNDGTLLKQFKNEIGLKVLNVDPATNLVAIAEGDGIESVADFWSVELAKKITDSHGKADLITATNVFAHVDDVHGFMIGCREALSIDGVLVLEFPYLIDFINGFEFDTIYFEHLSYFSIMPLAVLCESAGMKIIDVEKQNIHGGTMRVSIAHEYSAHEINNRFGNCIIDESAGGFNRLETYVEWGKAVNKTIDDFSTRIIDLKKQGFKIGAFAASAKGNTLLNSAGINTDIISFIADETPEKIGKYSPKTGIPIVNKQQILKENPDYIIILSWNFKDEIIAKLRKFYSGKIIVPLPVFEIID